MTYETTSARPRAGTLLKLAKVLNVSVDYLKNDDMDEINEVQNSNNTVKTKDECQLFGLLEVEALLRLNEAVFAGVYLHQEIKDAFFEGIMKAYVSTKDEARKLLINKNKIL